MLAARSSSASSSMMSMSMIRRSVGGGGGGYAMMMMSSGGSTVVASASAAAAALIPLHSLTVINKTSFGTFASWKWLQRRILALLRIQPPPTTTFEKSEASLAQNLVSPKVGQQLPKRTSEQWYHAESKLKSGGATAEQLKQSQSQEDFQLNSVSHLSSQQQPTSNMHRTIVAKFSAQMRVPMIKFIGARLPRPHFDPASFPPLPPPSAVASVTQSVTSSSPPVGKIPRGQGIEYWQLPASLRRQPISEEECAAINGNFC